MPVTSLPCQWKEPRKRKAAAMEVADTHFEKYEFGKIKKRVAKSIESFDPRPDESRNCNAQRLQQLLDDVRGKGLCISLLLDPSTCVQTHEQLPLTKEELLKKVEGLKMKLKVSEEEARQIEFETREQSNSHKWFEARRLRLTASLFGRVKQLKSTTPPDNLVLAILGVKRIPEHLKPLEYGRQMEKTALDHYVRHQHSCGHQDLYASPSGLLISTDYSVLGASPDANIYDPSNCEDPFGFAEIKCPYKYRDHTPEEAAENSNFMLCRGEDGRLHLKQSHVYFAQLQGQMGIGGRKWCDFIVYTNKGISIERIPFDENFWEDLCSKLLEFYNCCVAPEIVCPQYPFGLPMRDLRKE